MPAMRRVLVVDDEAPIRESLEMFLQEKGLEVITAGSAEAGLRAWRRRRPQVVILDVRLPDASGLEVLREITAKDPDLKVIMITAYHDMETTIEAMRQGAYDYIHKPLDVDELEHAVTQSLHIAAASVQNPKLLGDEKADPRRRIVGQTPEMRSIFKTIGLLSRNRASVLIQGETGTGKELIARVIHDSSGRAEPFVTVDCTTLVESLLESELFGHEKGAFTGAGEAKPGRLELAGEGTILFDEVGDLPLSLQAKLLRFLEYREFTRVGGNQVLHSRARIIAATNSDLAVLAREGRFRHDLLYRLNVITIQVPPLRDRLDDLPELMQFFLARINQELTTRVSRVEDGVAELLAVHHWPGNVRELRNVLTKAVLASRGPVLLAQAVREALAGASGEEPAGRLRSLEEVEREHIIASLRRTGGNLSAAARALGVSRPTLRKRLKQYGIRA
jgi:two-component system response regulator AtoC